MANKIKLVIPVLKEIEVEFTDSTFGPFAIDIMMCNGCHNEMGPDNPKGLFKVDNYWYKLCNSCLRQQGLV